MISRMRKYHSVPAGRTYIPMDPEAKSAIVRRVEERLGNLIIAPRRQTPFDVSRAHAMQQNAREMLIQVCDEERREELLAMIEALTEIIEGSTNNG